MPPERLTEEQQKEELATADADAATRANQEARDKDAEADEPEAQPDVDDDELTAAQAALKAEEDGDEGDKPADEPAEKPAEKPAEAQAEGEGEPAEPEPEAAPEGEAEGEGEPDDGETMIPKPRFDEVSKQRDDARAAEMTAREHAAYYQGLADAGAQVPAGAPGAEEMSPADQIVALRQTQNQDAKDYEDGKMTFPEYKAKESEIEDHIHEIRKADIVAASQPAPAAPAQSGFADDQVLESITDTLEDAHPFAREGVLSKDDWFDIEIRAKAELMRDGVNLQYNPNGTLTTPQQALQLRTKMAEVTDKWGPLITGKTREQLLSKDPNQAPVEPAPTGQLTPQQQARKDKLSAAGQHPLDTNQVGSGATAAVKFSEADIAKMTDEEIMERVPEAERRALLPVE